MVEWKEVAGRRCLYFTFRDRLTRDGADRMIDLWREAASTTSEASTLVWNCLAMKSYEPDARVRWQEAIEELKPGIGDVWVISTSSVVSVGVGFLAAFTSKEITMVASEAEMS